MARLKKDNDRMQHRSSDSLEVGRLFERLRAHLALPETSGSGRDALVHRRTPFLLLAPAAVASTKGNPEIRRYKLKADLNLRHQ